MDKQELMKKLKQSRPYLTKQQTRTIRGQILAGDLSGAEKGLNKLLKKQCPKQKLKVVRCQ